MNRARWGKLLGVAGITGVAATGVLVARNQRQRTGYSPEEVRARLHARLDQTETIPADAADAAEPGTAAAPAQPNRSRRWQRWIARPPRPGRPGRTRKPN